MIIFCDVKAIPKDIEIDSLYNFSSLSERGERLFTLLPPFRSEQFRNERDFDMLYAAYILENDYVFKDFFKIVYSQYENGVGSNTVVLVGRDEIRDIMTESVIKLIQQRYGINSYLINEAEDWEDIDYDDDATNFDVPGVLTFDQDKERFVDLTVDISKVIEENRRNGESIIPKGELQS